ncbi:MAG: sulfite exporter TauE/SafE family protein [Chitinophagaceae bacterium]|nr:sulfite exporter TauE/SafE family protein [Chitinophagaceae bacterium]
MEILGYAASLLIGISLGLIGGGGSILTVPVLVYLFRVDPVLATAYSLFIVGATSLVGAYPKYKSGELDIRTAVIFGIPSIAAVFATRKFIIPALPQKLLTIGGFTLTKPLFLMILFAVLMISASYSMIKNNGLSGDEETPERRFNYPLIFLEGIVVGVLTGLVGAGGGFLIIPALVLLSKLPMKQAVGTSLLIIAAKSLIGFIGDLSSQKMDWPLLLSITALAIAGIFLGNHLSKKISSGRLKKVFGWFVLVMGIYILIKEIFFSGNLNH